MALGGGLTVTSLMRQSARYNAHRIAVRFKHQQLTYAQAWQRGVKLANWLLALNLKPGDRVGILEDNSLEAQDCYI